MLLKANLRSNLDGRADYLLRHEQNEVSEPLFVRGLVNDDDLDMAYAEMTDIIKKHKKPFLSISVNPSPPYDQAMTREQWLRAVEIIDQHNDLHKQPVIATLHKKRDDEGVLRSHIHVDYIRVKEDGRLISDSNMRHKLVQKCKVQMELEFGHTRTKDYDRVEYAKAQGRMAKPDVADTILDTARDMGRADKVADKFADNKDLERQRFKEMMDRQKNKDQELER